MNLIVCSHSLNIYFNTNVNVSVCYFTAKELYFFNLYSNHKFHFLFLYALCLNIMLMLLYPSEPPLKVNSNAMNLFYVVVQFVDMIKNTKCMKKYKKLNSNFHFVRSTFITSLSFSCSATTTNNITSNNNIFWENICINNLLTRFHQDFTAIENILTLNIFISTRNEK